MARRWTLITCFWTTNAKVIQSFFNIFHQDCKRSFERIKSKAHSMHLGTPPSLPKLSADTYATIGPFDSGWLTTNRSVSFSIRSVDFEDLRVAGHPTRARLLERVNMTTADGHPEDFIAMVLVPFPAM